MCRCAERRKAIVQGGAALVQGNLAQVQAQAAFVARSSVQDVAQAMRLAAARVRLSR